MPKKEFSVINDYNEKIYGSIDSPNINKKKYKTIILISGFGVNRDNNGIFIDLSKGLTKKGYLVYRFDFSGCGHSQGEYSQTSVTKLIEELEKVYNFVKLETDVDEKNIGIIGNCTGSIIAYNSNIRPKAMILINAHYDILSVMKKIFLDNLNTKGKSTRVSSRGKEITLQSNFWEDLKLNHKNIADKVKKIKSPILYIHSEKSNLVPFEQAKKLYNLTRSKKEIIKIKDASHNFTSHRKQLSRVIAKWFSKHLK